MKVLFISLLISFNSFAVVTHKEFIQVKEALTMAYEELKQSDDEYFSINTIYPGMSPTIWWDNAMVHASYVFTDINDVSIHHIYLMGGFIKQVFMTPDGLALTGCHEIGHGLGGEPKKNSELPDPPRLSTVEGQADYYSTKKCLDVVFKHLPKLRKIVSKPEYLELCSKQSKYNTKSCLRMMNAIAVDEIFLNTNLQQGQKPVSFSEYSNHVQTELDLSPRYYPGRQCRLDTMINGVLGLAQPECWYPGGERNGSLR